MTNQNKKAKREGSNLDSMRNKSKSKNIPRFFSLFLALCLVASSIVVPNMSVSAEQPEIDGRELLSIKRDEGVLDTTGKYKINEADAITEYVGGYDETGRVDIPEQLTVKDSDGTEVTRTVKGIAKYAFAHDRYDYSDNGDKLISIAVPKTVTYISEGAFYGAENLVEVGLLHGVINIDDYAFAGCENLNTIEIPSSVTHIGRGVFEYCDSLASIGVPKNSKHYKSDDGVLYKLESSNNRPNTLIKYPVAKKGDSYKILDSTFAISSYAFDSVKYLKEVTFPNSVRDIESYAFFGASSIESMDIKHVSKLGTGVFSNMTGLNTFEGGYLTEIPADTFSNCVSLRSISLYEGITKIGDYAFLNCSNLDNVAIPPYVTHIGAGAFTANSDLKTLSIPDRVTHIGDSAFSYCINLETVTIPESVSHIGSGVFGGCNSLTAIKVDKFNKNYTSDEDGVLFNKTDRGISRELIQYPSGRDATKYDIPSDVTTINDSAFVDTKLKEIVVPNGVTNMGAYTFSGNVNLESINIPTGTNKIEAGLFAGCTNLKSLVIPKNIKFIGDKAFSRCYGLENVNIVGINVTIGNNAFEYCEDLVNIFLDGVVSIGDYAFLECDKLINITVPNTVKTIGNNAFEGCNNLEYIVLGTGLETIGNNAFQDCGNFTSITIPSNVTHIGEGAFGGCTKLRTINVDSNANYSSEDGVLFNHDKTELVQYPSGLTNKSYFVADTVEVIGDAAFANASHLTSVVIPDSVYRIGERAFSNASNLHNLSMGSNVVFIDSFAFEHNKSLESFEIPDTLEYLGESVFNGSNKITGMDISEFHDVFYVDQDAGVLFNKDKTDLIYFFKNVQADSTYSVPNTVTTIRAGAFEGNIKLSNVTIPDSVRYIETDAFARMGYLSSINIPSSVVELGQSPFRETKQLSNISVSGDNTSYSAINGVLFDKIGSSLIKYPSAKDVESYEIPSGVVHTEAYAFEGVNALKSVGISDTINTMAERSFYDCRNLMDITFNGNAPTYFGSTLVTDQSVFDGWDSFTIHQLPGTTGFGKTTEWDKYDVSYEQTEILGGTTIKINADANNIKQGATFTVVPSENEDKLADDESIKAFKMFDITLMSGEDIVQPYGDVTVSITVPEGYNEDIVYVYRVLSDGKRELMEGSIVDGSYVFVTDHFSDYSIVVEVGNPINFTSAITEDGLQVTSKDDRLKKVSMDVYRDNDKVSSTSTNVTEGVIDPLKADLKEDDIVHVIVNNYNTSDTRSGLGANSKIYRVADGKLIQVVYESQVANITNEDLGVDFTSKINNPYSLYLTSGKAGISKVNADVYRGDEQLNDSGYDSKITEGQGLVVFDTELKAGDKINLVLNKDLDAEATASLIVTEFGVISGGKDVEDEDPDEDDETSDPETPTPTPDPTDPIDDDEDTKDEDVKDEFNLIQFSVKIVGEKSLQVTPDKVSDEDRFVEALAHLYRDGEVVAVQESEGDTLEFMIPIVEDDIIHVIVNNGREGANNALFVVGADSQLEKISYTTQTTFVSSTDDDASPFSIVVDNPYTIRINAEDDRADKVSVKVRRGDEYLAPQEKGLHDKTSLFVFSEGLLEGDVVEVTVKSGIDGNYGTAVIKAFNDDLPNPDDDEDKDIKDNDDKDEDVKDDDTKDDEDNKDKDKVDDKDKTDDKDSDEDVYPFTQTITVNGVTITISAKEGVILDGTFDFKSINTASNAKLYMAMKEALGSGIKDFRAFDITLLDNNKKAIQPNGYVKVSMSIPEVFDKDNVNAYRIEPNGRVVKVNGQVVGDNYEFEANHFSYYVLAEGVAKNAVDDVTNTDNTNTDGTNTSNRVSNNANNNANNPKTGDEAPVALYASILGGGIILLGVILVYNREKFLS